MPDEEKTSNNPRDEKAFIALARKRFEQAEQEERHLRDEAELDLRFVAGDQWDANVKAERLRNKRAMLTFPRCHTFVQQVSNEARQQKPQIKFVAGDGGDEETAEVYEGMARHIQYDSDAQIAYETAVEFSAGGGFGYYRFLTDYCDEETFNQDLKIVPVYDPFSVYGVLIPSCLGQEPRFAFVIEHLTKEEYQEAYPKSQLSDMDWAVARREASEWITDQRVRIAEYWWITEQEETLKADGKERKVSRCYVHTCKINGVEVLEGTETDWPGYCIPIVPVLGKQMFVGGRPILFSVVRHQRDPQRLLNFYKTRIAETLGTVPIQPYMVAVGQIRKEDERLWAQSNTTTAPYLYYNPTEVNGKLVGPPQRQVFEPPIASLSEAAAQEIDDMKATAGIFDASLGAQSNESSGIALQRRQQQSNATNMHFLDNLERAFRKGGRIIAEVMPKIYDTPRMVRILGADETPDVVRVNEIWHRENAKPVHYKVGGDGVGKYEVVVTMGKAYSTKRMESFDFMQQIIQAVPQAFPQMADILFANADSAGADQLSERFKRMLPPQLQDDDKSDPKQQVQVLQAQLAQLSQAHQALNAWAQKAQQDLESKAVENQARVQIEQMKSDTSRAIEQMKIEAQIAIAEINTKAQNERERIKLEADLNAKLQVQDREQAHELGMTAVNQGHESDMAGRQQAHEAVMGERQHEQNLEAQDQAGQQAMMQAQQQAELNPPQDKANA